MKNVGGLQAKMASTFRRDQLRLQKTAFLKPERKPLLCLSKVDTLSAANDGDQNDLRERSHDLHFSVLMLRSLYLDYAKQMSHPCLAKNRHIRKSQLHP